MRFDTYNVAWRWAELTESYFLGANSKDGFQSLYGGFCHAEGDYLTIIKGGPGTGKSGFMRKIGQVAEKRGLNVEYVLCSGDPDSLDGVYIPSLHRGWVDGTAPHVAEPKKFGINSDYVNLGQFCTGEFDDEDKHAIDALYSKYKRDYAAAYDYLAAAWATRRGYMPPLFNGELRDVIRRRINNIIHRAKRRDKYNLCEASGSCERYMHALTCKGELWLENEIASMADLIYAIDDGYGGADIALQFAAEEAATLGAATILCRDPLDINRLDAVILPEWRVAFAMSGYGIEGARHIRLDAAVDNGEAQKHRAEIREGRQIEERLKASALSRLAVAKQKHDELEVQYIARMDFPALTEFTDKYIAKVFER